MKIAYINLYLSGFFHRANKPEQFNVHPGDIYPSAEAAMRDVYPQELYIGTVPVHIPTELQHVLGQSNPYNAVPIPLEETKAAYDLGGAIGLIDYITQARTIDTSLPSACVPAPAPYRYHFCDGGSCSVCAAEQVGG